MNCFNEKDPPFWLIALFLVALISHLSPWVMVMGCPLSSPTLHIDTSHYDFSEILNRGSDFIDLRVGSNLTLVCEGPLMPGNWTEESRQIEWILPEFHPLYESTLPDYIQVSERVIPNRSLVRSELRVTSVETGDVGPYLCLYSAHLHLAEHSLRSDDNSFFLYVTDSENLFVKSMPILTAIYNRSIEIACRPSSSRSTMSLFKIDAKTGRHIELSFAFNNQTDRKAYLSTGQSRMMINSIEYNSRRGFLIDRITDDRFICRVRLSEGEKDQQQDNSIIIQYTNGIEHATRPTIKHANFPYAFLGDNFTLSCQVEKSQSSHIFVKWQLVNQTCYEPILGSSILVEEVETISLRKGRDLMRLNLTLPNVSLAYDGAIFECIINDVSMAQKVAPFSLRVYESPSLRMVPLSSTSQVLRCNRQLKFEVDIYAIPNELEYLDLAWFKDNSSQTIPLGDSRVNLYKNYCSANESNSCLGNHTSGQFIRAGILILNLVPEDSDLYTFKASLMKGLLNESVTLGLNVMPCHISDLDDNYFLYLIAIGFVIFAMMLFIFLLVNRIRVEKKAKQDLEILSYNLLSSGNAAVDSKGLFSPLDPNVPVHEQIDLLRYDCRWEFPLESIDFGPILGQGAFGKVYKASAYGLKTCTKAYSHVATVCESNQCGTEVAVKMLKHCATMEQLKSLLSELKVLNYIGSHVNIVNLLGACTANLVKGELYVLMEYCCHGNLQQYLTRNRHRFARKSNVSTTAETSVESEISVSVTDKEDTHRDLFKNRLANLLSRHLFEHPKRQTEDGHELANVKFKCNGNANDCKEECIQFEAACEPFDEQDLVDYAFQTACGMQYLASKKLIHRDLAARNVLLGKNKIIKICDFGLTRDFSDYSSNYVKKHDEPLPVKWMAIESLRDKVYTTKSDVWSFGVFLWEIFSLGITPYPGMLVDSQFYQRLVDGHRMEQPKQSSDSMYQLMLECWLENAEIRPDFDQIVYQLQTQVCPKFYKNYQVVRKSYEEYNLERVGDQARLYETLQGISNKGSLKSTAQPDYIAMTDGFSRQNSRIEAATSLLFEGANLAEVNYVQMELPLSSDSELPRRPKGA